MNDAFHFFYRLKKGLKSFRFSQELSAATALDADQISKINFNRIKALVRHCQLNVPYYTRRFIEIGFNWQELQSHSDLSRLPILEKEHIREFQDELISTNVKRKKLRAATTGGTTGEPLTIYNDPSFPISVLSWRMLKIWGVDASDNSGYLYRAVPRGARKKLSDLALFPTRRAYLAAAEMNRLQMERFYEELRRIQPKYLVGYVGAFDAFADFLNQTGRRIPSLKVIWTTAAPLPKLKRAYLREIYSCPIYTQYGSVETYTIGAESPEMNGLYIYSDVRHVEILNGNQVVHDGTLGDVVVSDLTNYAFPLLRYRLGDQSRLLAPDPNANLPFPRMDYVKGRISDNIKLPDGTAIAGEFWTTIFDDYPNDIKSFQILQRKDYSIEVSYEPKSENYAQAVESVRKTLQKKIDNSVSLSFLERPINNNENGKTRFVKSELV